MHSSREAFSSLHTQHGLGFVDAVAAGLRSAAMLEEVDIWGEDSCEPIVFGGFICWVLVWRRGMYWGVGGAGFGMVSVICNWEFHRSGNFWCHSRIQPQLAYL